MMDVNDSQLLNAKDPIDSTDDGMAVDIRFLQPEKAFWSMEDTPSSITIDCICFEKSDHGQEDALQHDIDPCPDMVRVDVSSLNFHERLPQVPEFSSRKVSLPSACPFRDCTPSKESFAVSP